MNQPTVIIPVHNALLPLRACLESLDRHSPDAHVLVIDDASTDSGVRTLLQTWVEQSECRRLQVQDQNRGFVATVNRGMAATKGDVVLLNSDTRVTPGWLEALARCLDSDPAIATATPWSNNGEIVSWPRFCANNEPPRHPEAVAAAVIESQHGDYPDLPTAVGFCMAISRRALNRLGWFDEAAFGLGYGEENDFSCRAVNEGFRNVLCHDAYVVHEGGQSFGPLGLAPNEQSMARLLAKHPDYLERVQAYIAADPLASRREAIARALEAQSVGAA